jgi:plasmid stability protein
MANLTIVVDDELLKRARVRAVQEGISVNEVCRQAIERFAGHAVPGGAAAIAAQLRQIAAQMRPSPDGEPIWPGREALYEEVMRELGLYKDKPTPKKGDPE